MSDEPKSRFTPAELKKMLQRQVADLEKARTLLQRQGKTADDDPQLMDVVLELRAFRKTLAAFERDLGGESTREEESE